MAYSDIALLQGDPDFRARVTAATSVESEAGTLPAIDPNATAQWVHERLWRFASQPGFGDAYGYAVATGVPRPGNDPSVITDGQILAAVLSIYEADNPPVPEPGVTAVTPDQGPPSGGTVVTITGTGFQEA
jgi:hypothetical protein